MPKILITGGTGLVGETLTTHLIKAGFTIKILTRRKPAKRIPNVEYILWNIDDSSIDKDAIHGVDSIIHLAGAGVMEKRWTEKYKKEIIDSRVKSAELLINTLRKNANTVKTIISASAIGWYGGDKNGPDFKGFTESDPSANNFLGETCKLWEECVEAAQELNIRVVKLRFGIVLSDHGGALEEFRKPLSFGIATILSSGKQVISWIHIYDLARMILFCLQHDNISGSYNAVAPQPASNKELVLQLAKRIRKNSFIPIHVPSFMIKIMLGESAIEVLKSSTVRCDKIKNEGFTFLYPSIQACLDDLEKTTS